MHEIAELYPFKSHFLPVQNDLKMHYIEEGTGEKTLLMVHGNPTWSFYYRNLVRDLSSDYRCIAIDHLGCGLSDRDEETFNLEKRIQHLEKFIKEKDLRNITLIAHDWGGAIGMGVLVRNQERFDKIVLMNTAAFNSTEIPKRIALCKVPVLGRFLNRGLNGFALAASVMASKKGLSSKVKSGYLMPYRKYSERKAIDDFVHDIPLSPNHKTYQTLEGIETELAKLKLPTLLMWGDLDFCFHPGFKKRFIDFLPHAQVVSFEKAGHYVLEDEYDSCLDQLKRFLKY